MFQMFTGAKVMIVGCKLNDILSLTVPTKQELADEATATSNKEALSKQKLHRKVLDKGVPDDVMPGILDSAVRIKIRKDIATIDYSRVFQLEIVN